MTTNLILVTELSVNLEVKKSYFQFCIIFCYHIIS